jgi:hypothetical protein
MYTSIDEAHPVMQAIVSKAAMVILNQVVSNQ